MTVSRAGAEGADRVHGGGRSRAGTSVKPVRIVISYRRDDSAGHAGHLYADLRPKFDVFMDIDNIPPGSDFAEVIHDAIADCDVMIVLIGQSWLTATDRKGRRRIRKADDFVRLELEAALKSEIKVLPVLVEGAEMPSSEDLPTSVRALARRNALEISDRRWSVDVGELITVLEELAREKARRSAAPTRVEKPHSPAEPAGQPPVLALSQTAVAIDGIEPGDDVPPRRIDVSNRGGGTLDWTVETAADWLDVHTERDFFTIRMRPRPGVNRASVVVRDRASGMAETVTVRVTVTELPATPRPVAPTTPPSPAWPVAATTPSSPPARSGTSVPTSSRALTRPALIMVALAVPAALIVGLLLLFGGNGGGGGAASLVVAVPSTEVWTSTAVRVEAGHTVRITATGEVRPATERQGVANGPDGLPSLEGFPHTLSFPTNVLQGQKHAALIGRIGESGTPFFVGAQKSFTADRGGVLYLGINDTGVDNNAGEFRATITTET